MIDKESKINKVKLIGTIKNKTANHLFWSPQGKMIVLAGLKTMNGQFEFFNVDEMETMASCEHFMATDVEWDPTGRYVTTAVTSVHHRWRTASTSGPSTGSCCTSTPGSAFTSFCGARSAPSRVLSKEKEEEIVKNLKKYSKRFDELDESIRGQQDSHRARRRSRRCSTRGTE